VCKPGSCVSEQAAALAARLIPPRITARIDRRVVMFLLVLGAFTAAIAALLALVGFEYGTIAPEARTVIHTTLWAVFFGLFIMAGIAAWLLVLNQASRRTAEAETTQQTDMLMAEIAAHERTDAALEKAKAAAESANTAKSRYIVGVIHEIRAPLNAIFGYAQLLERAGTLRPEDAVRVIRRSAEHLSNLVDGLLDISQIETGALQLHRDRVNLAEFLDQIADMFRLAAAAKGIGFTDERSRNLPQFVHTDEKRLRQILINLLSNGVKYTERGGVTFRVRRRGQVTEFEVIDTGHGIRPEDMAAIFEPFERGHLPAANAVPGTGLGLTISKLLTQILGGEIVVESEVGRGSVFRVRLLLSEAAGGKVAAVAERRITGYAGARRRILVADDDPGHLELLHDILVPLGFVLFSAADGTAALALAEDCAPDLAILDIAMPGMSGLDVAAALRSRFGEGLKILIVSGNFHDAPRLLAGEAEPPAHDAYLPKPTDIRALHAALRDLLELSWVFDEAVPVVVSAVAPPAMRRPPDRHVTDLIRLGRIGYVRGIEAKLDELAEEAPEAAAYLRELVRRFELGRYMQYLEALE
jgi:signal transduction histidine kinase/CheY-like chemotaxis protein